MAKTPSSSQQCILGLGAGLDFNVNLKASSLDPWKLVDDTEFMIEEGLVSGNSWNKAGEPDLVI